MNTKVLIWMNEGTSNVKYGYENRIKRSQITTYLCKHLHLHRRKNRWICLTPLFSIVYTPTASMFPEWFLAPTFSPPPLMDRPQSYISSASSNRTLKKVVEYQVLYFWQKRFLLIIPYQQKKAVRQQKDTTARTPKTIWQVSSILWFQSWGLRKQPANPVSASASTVGGSSDNGISVVRLMWGPSVTGSDGNVEGSISSGSSKLHFLTIRILIHKKN